MELVRSIPITEYCDKIKLTTRQRLDLFIKVCRAIQHAHQKGIIHRDIKPSNVLVTQIDGAAVPKVIDFGVAKAIGQKLSEQTVYTQFAQMIGTPLYMSPEQAEMSGVDVDTRSDVYSLGVLLYELLSGTTPFDKDALKQAGYDEIRRIIREDEPPKPSSRASTLKAEQLSTISGHLGIDSRKYSHSLKGEIDWIVMKALEKDRTRRHESASAFAADIERYLNDEPVEACPPSAGYRFKKVVRRNTVALTTTALVVLALLLGTGVSIWQAREAVDRYFTLVSESTLLDEPGLQPLRLELIEGAITFYEKFASRNSDDPEVQLELTATHLRLAQIYHSMSRLDDMILALEKGFTLVEKTIQQRPAKSDAYLALAGFWHGGRSLPELVWKPLTDPSHALSVLRKGGGQWKQLVEAHPNVPGFRSDLSKFYHMVSDQQTVLGQQEQALRSNQRLIDLREKLVRLYPDVPEYKSELSYAYWELAFLVRRNSPDEAEELYRRAITTQQEAHLPVYRANLATMHNVFARFLLQHNRPDEAIQGSQKATAIFKRLVDEYPHISGYQTSLASSQLLLASLLTESGRTDEVNKLLLDSIATNPRTAEEYARRADLYVKLKDHEKALADYEAAVKINPNNHRIQLDHAKALKSHHCPGEAISNLSLLIEEYPTSSTYHRYQGVVLCDLGRHEEALKYFDKSIELLATDGDLKTYESRVMLFVKMKQFKKAVADYDQYVKRSSNSASAHFTRGEFYLNTLKNYKQALVDFDIAIEKNPNAWHWYKRRGLAHFYLEQYEKALADIAKAVELNPEDASNLWWIHPEQVAACPNKEFRDGILKLADKTIKLTKDSAAAYAVRAIHHIVRKNYELARADFKKAAESPKAGYYAQYLIALFALNYADHEDYRKSCQKMLQHFANSEVTNELHFTAWTCALAPNNLDDYSPAIALARKAVTLQPGKRSNLQAFGAILFRAGHPEEALTQLNASAAVPENSNTGTAYTWYFLAMTHHQLENAKEARTWFTKANAHTQQALAENKTATGESMGWNRRLTLELL
jgi:tetratricopeptide (TPR) repeat protein